MARIKVAVSPFYGGEEWTDKGTGITFQKDNQHQMNVYSIPENKDLSGIIKAIRLNTLILVEGNLDEVKEASEVKKEEVKVPEVKEEVVEEKVEVEETPAPKPAPRKRTTKK